MKFLVDAQLPRRLTLLLEQHGHAALHTLDLPAGNATPDEEINALSAREKWVVVSKDGDFFQDALLRAVPYKFLYVSTGNMTNSDLETLFLTQLEGLVVLLQESRVVELSREAVIAHF